MRNKGFTLIELLMVISIIGLLSSIVSVQLNNARIKAGDTKRLEDKNQVIAAMNLYYSDHGFFPATDTVNGEIQWHCLGPSTESCFHGDFGPFYGKDSQTLDLQPYLPRMPTLDASAGNFAYNRLLYNPTTDASMFSAGGPFGAYLVWAEEQTIPTSRCSSFLPPQHYDKYWYCIEYLGK